MLSETESKVGLEYNVNAELLLSKIILVLRVQKPGLRSLDSQELTERDFPLVSSDQSPYCQRACRDFEIFM